MANIISKDSVPYRIWDKATSTWHKLNFNTNAKSVDATDGKTLETKVGAINGITSSFASTATDIAASASTVYELNKKLSNHFEISEATLSSCTLATAIGLLLANASEKGTYSGRFKCSSGWFTFYCYYANDGGYNSGYVCSISDGTAYTFYCKAGADAVLKKLGRSSFTITNYYFSAGRGGCSATNAGNISVSGGSSLTLDVSEYDTLYIGSYTTSRSSSHGSGKPTMGLIYSLDGATAVSVGSSGTTVDVSGVSSVNISETYSGGYLDANYSQSGSITVSEITLS